LRELLIGAAQALVEILALLLHFGCGRRIVAHVSRVGAHVLLRVRLELGHSVPNGLIALRPLIGRDAFKALHVLAEGVAVLPHLIELPLHLGPVGGRCGLDALLELRELLIGAAKSLIQILALLLHLGSGRRIVSIRGGVSAHVLLCTRFHLGQLVLDGLILLGPLVSRDAFQALNVLTKGITVLAQLVVVPLHLFALIGWRSAHAVLELGELLVEPLHAFIQVGSLLVHHFRRWRTVMDWRIRGHLREGSRRNEKQRQRERWNPHDGPSGKGLAVHDREWLLKG